MLRMESTAMGRRELEGHLEAQMRAQERQLVWVRLGMVLVAALLLLLLERDLAALPVLVGLLALVAAATMAIPLLLIRFPAREVGIVSTALDMAAVTVAVYVVGPRYDVYLFYGLVVLGTALRFGLGASIWSSVVMAGMYVVVVLATASIEALGVPLLVARTTYIVGSGVVAGLFSRIVIGRATENAALQLRLDEEARERERTRERDLLSRLGRDFGASLDRDTTTATIAAAAGPLLGDASLVLTADDTSRRLVPVAQAGRGDDLAIRWLEHVGGRRPRFGEGILGTAAATAASVEGGREAMAPGDPDGFLTLELAWILAVPIASGGRLLGVLATTGRDERGPTPRLRRLAEAMAERAGPALQNAQLWSDLQERMAREQAAQRIKDDFLSIVSHELRTPLTSIQGYSQLLEGRLRSGASGESKEMAHLKIIRSQVGRMRRLVDDLLDVSRIDRRGGVSLETGDFDLVADVREAVARLRREQPDRSIELRAPDSLTIHADRDRIDQVMSNLLENAVKYSPDGGPIRVSLDVRAGEVEVIVADEGLGIPDEHRANVFERFYQAEGDVARRRFGGLGLGLYISRAIVDAHGGRIWAARNTEAGRGSVFGFRVPRVAMPSAPVGIAPTGEPPPFVVRRTDR